MTQLHTQQCEACRAGAPHATAEERTELMQDIPEWEISEREDGVDQLQRDFEFSNFEEALAFTNRVGAIAEEEGHHPEIVTTWGRATVRWWSHKIRGLHRNDFIMAAKTDQVYSP